MSERDDFGGPGMCDHIFWNDDVEDRGRTYLCKICDTIFTEEDLLDTGGMSPCCDSLDFVEVD